MLVLILLGLAIIFFQYKRPLLFLVLIFGYLVNIGLILTQRFVRPLFFSSDQVRFYDYAIELSNLVFLEFLAEFNPGQSYVISWFAGLIFKVFGQDLLYVNFFFVFAWIGTIIFAYKLSCLIILNKKKASLISGFVALIPSLSILNAAFLRESLIIFFFMGFFYYLLCWYIKRSFRLYLISLLLLFLAGVFHGAFILLIPIVIGCFILEVFKKRKIKYVELFFIFLVLLASFPVGYKAINNVKVQMAISLLSADTKSIDKYLQQKDRSDYEGINSLSMPQVDLSNPFNAAFSIASRSFYFSSSPFIHHYYKITDIPRIYDSLIFIFCLILLFTNYRKIKHSKERLDFFYKKLFIPLVLFLIVLFSLGSFDVGTSQRHRLKFLPVVVVVTLSYRQRAISNRRHIIVNGLSHG